jgi:hypothetical protein
MFRPLTIIEKRLFYIGFVTVLIVALVTLASINRYRLFVVETDYRLLHDRVLSDETARESRWEALRVELDEIERTLYAAPDAPPPPVRRSSVVEQWMVNNDNELRKRIAALERRLYRLEQ